MITISGKGKMIVFESLLSKLKSSIYLFVTLLWYFEKRNTDNVLK